MSDVKIPEDLRELYESTAEWDGVLMCAFAEAKGIPLPWRIGPDAAVRQYLIERIAALEAERLRYYHADGTFEMLATAQEVIERRVGAAKEIEALRAQVERLAAPVSDEEWEKIRHNAGIPPKRTTIRTVINSVLIAARGDRHGTH